MCFRDIMKHNNKNFVGGRGAFKVGEELNYFFTYIMQFRHFSENGKLPWNSRHGRKYGGDVGGGTLPRHMFQSVSK